MNTDEVTRWVREYIQGCEHADFKAYAEDLGAVGSGRFLWLMEHIVGLGRMHDGRILDIGCGFGWQAVAISILSRGHIVANDIRPLMTSIVAERVDAIRKKGSPVSVEVLTADICALKLPEASFDAIVCNQTIEHVHDLEATFRVAYRLLKPGGRIVVTNDNNALNRKGLADAREMWKKRDSDWDYIEELKSERPVENREIQPYAVMRKEIVRAANPSLSEKAVRALVEATAGLIQPEIERFATTYTPGSTLPTPPALSPCRNPITGEYCERQLDPFDVALTMRSCGFEADVRHGFRRQPFRSLNGIKLRSINRWLFQFRPFFILAGTRPG